MVQPPPLCSKVCDKPYTARLRARHCGGCVKINSNWHETKNDKGGVYFIIISRWFILFHDG